jgi:hypothetical protein
VKLGATTQRHIDTTCIARGSTCIGKQYVVNSSKESVADATFRCCCRRLIIAKHPARTQLFIFQPQMMKTSSGTVSQIANHFFGSFNAAIAAPAANGEVWIVAWARCRHFLLDAVYVCSKLFPGYSQVECQFVQVWCAAEVVWGATVAMFGPTCSRACIPEMLLQKSFCALLSCHPTNPPQTNPTENESCKTDCKRKYKCH